MQQSQSTQFSKMNRRLIAAATAATLAQLGGRALAGTTAGEVTISTSGSTALKNWFTAGTFTDIQPGQTLTIAGVTYPLANAGNGNSSTGEWVTNGGGTYLYQLAPKNYNGGVAVQGQVADQASAVRLEYHESGSVEGILEMANDQIGPITYVTQNVNRDPYVGIGNAVWVNYNQFSGKGGIAWSASSGGSSNGYTLGDFYNQNTSNGSPAIPPVTFTLGGTAQPMFNLSGGNMYGGQNAVQMALSDAIPVQVFASDNTVSTSSQPWTLTPQNAGFGQGNKTLVAGNLGTTSSRQVYQSTAALNMPSGAINPRTGTAFGTGAWNSAELGNLNSQTIATTATLFVANPGTGLTQVDRTDAQWLETTSRLQNGAVFNMTTRDVNSGTRNVAALETGIDPTWATGVNDAGNGNATDGATNQITIGAGLRYSNKTAGGNELRPTVQAARMAVGTLSINDASGDTVNSFANPLRALSYSDSTDGSAPYVAANYYTVAGVTNSSVNPNGQQYTIFQNEQAVTLKAPDANYSSGSPNIQGDDSYGDTKTLLNSTLNSVAAYNGSSGLAASPAAGLITQGYIIPQLMAVQKSQNGLNQAGLPSQIVANPNYNASYPSTAGFTTLVSKLATGDPSTVTAGSTSFYGGSTAAASGVTATNGFGGVGFNGQIPITSLSNNAGSTAGGNWLFGNFNQNGVRDYDAVVVKAQKSQAALEAGTSPAGNNAYAVTGQMNNSTTVTTGIAALDTMNSGSPATKGDLITMGDFNGDGKFDGRDLYLMATGASLSSANNRPTEVGSVFTTGQINASAGTFSTVIATAVLNKNVALDYLQTNATTAQKLEARVVLSGSNVPVGATNLNTTDPETGLAQFTFDATGANAFNKSDVNQDGVVDFNDALEVDALNGKSFTSLSDSLTATTPTPVTGVNELANLVLAIQIDTNTSVGASDLAVVSKSLTGTGTNNWYAYTAAKTGPGTITWNRTTGSTVNVYTGASLNISAGTIQAITAGVDPFTDNNQNAPTTLNDTSKSLPVTLTGGTLEYTGSGSTIQLDRLSSLNISAGSVVLDPVANHAGRSVLELGGLTVSSIGTLDMGNNDAIVEKGSLSTLTALAKTGFNGGAWNGSGIASTSAANDSAHLTAVGVILNSVNGTPLYGTGGTLGSFDGVMPVVTDVLVKYTYYGDTNLDGKVDGSDYAKIDYAFVHTGTTGWANGDFNYDGVVDGSDYTLIDNAFNAQGATLTASVAAQVAGTTAVPEPASMLLVPAVVVSLLGRRRGSMK